jgi:hypothetical protein
MSDQAQPQNPAGNAPSAPEGRSTSFQALQGQSEHYSGEVLLVSAYAVLWALLLAWVALVWRKQSTLDAKLTELERQIDKAAAAAGVTSELGNVERRP